MIQTVVRRSTSRTFQRSFGLILVAEAITIFVAWLLLGFNSDRWIPRESPGGVTSLTTGRFVCGLVSCWGNP